MGNDTTGRRRRLGRWHGWIYLKAFAVAWVVANGLVTLLLRALLGLPLVVCVVVWVPLLLFLFITYFGLYRDDAERSDP